MLNRWLKRHEIEAIVQATAARPDLTLAQIAEMHGVGLKTVVRHRQNYPELPVRPRGRRQVPQPVSPTHAASWGPGSACRS